MKINQNIFVKLPNISVEDYKDYDHNETVKSLIALDKKERKLRLIASSPFAIVVGASFYGLFVQHSSDIKSCIIAGVTMGLVAAPTICSSFLESFPRFNFFNQKIKTEITSEKEQILSNLKVLCMELNFQNILLSYLDNLISNFNYYNHTNILDKTNFQWAIHLTNFRINLMNYFSNNKNEQAAALLMDEFHLYIIKHAEKCVKTIKNTTHLENYQQYQKQLGQAQNTVVINNSINSELEQETPYQKYL